MELAFAFLMIPLWALGYVFIVPLVSWAISLSFLLFSVFPIFWDISRYINWWALTASVVWLLTSYHAWWLSGFDNPIPVDLLFIIPPVIWISIRGVKVGCNKQAVKDFQPVEMFVPIVVLVIGLLLLAVSAVVVYHKRLP